MLLQLVFHTLVNLCTTLQYLAADKLRAGSLRLCQQQTWIRCIRHGELKPWIENHHFVRVKEFQSAIWLSGPRPLNSLPRLLPDRATFGSCWWPSFDNRVFGVVSSGRACSCVQSCRCDPKACFGLILSRVVGWELGWDPTLPWWRPWGMRLGTSFALGCASLIAGVFSWLLCVLG